MNVLRILFTLGVLLALGQETVADSLIGRLMTPEQFKAAGLHKLTPSELAHLDSWIASAVLVHGRPESPSGASVAPELDRLEGCELVADDGTFLGVISRNSVGARSIANTVGRYGSSVSRTSIFNSVGRYGSSVSRLSPFNSITRTPPSIKCHEKLVAFLTTNTLKSPSVDPEDLKRWLGRDD